MSLFYTMPELNKLDPGVISLGAPIMDGAVQMDAEDLNLIARLEVTVDPPHITIAREDGEHLQIDATLFDEALESHRTSILAEPVAQLVLKDTKQDGIWFVVKDEDLTVYNTDALRYFIYLVADNGVRKQNKVN
jgi:hypothetical protein